MAKSVKKSDAATKVVAKLKKSTENDSVENKFTEKKSAEPTATAKKPVASSNGTGGSIPRDQVALLAHRFFEDRGRKHGHDEEDWLRAEQELHAKAS